MILKWKLLCNFGIVERDYLVFVIHVFVHYPHFAFFPLFFYSAITFLQQMLYTVMFHRCRLDYFFSDVANHNCPNLKQIKCQNGPSTEIIIRPADAVTRAIGDVEFSIRWGILDLSFIMFLNDVQLRSELVKLMLQKLFIHDRQEHTMRCFAVRNYRRVKCLWRKNGYSCALASEYAVNLTR